MFDAYSHNYQRVKVLPLAMKKSDVTEPNHSRFLEMCSFYFAGVLSCRLFGILSRHVDSSVILDKFFKQTMSLCQDTAHEVRFTMAQQLPSLSRALG